MTLTPLHPGLHPAVYRKEQSVPASAPSKAPNLPNSQSSGVTAYPYRPLRFGSTPGEIKFAIPESGIEPSFLAFMKRAAISNAQTNQLRPTYLSLPDMFQALLEDPEMKKEGEKIFLNILKVAPHTFLSKLNEARAQKAITPTPVTEPAEAQASDTVVTAEIGVQPSGMTPPSLARSIPELRPQPRPDTRPGQTKTPPVVSAQPAGPLQPDFMPNEAESREAKGMGELVADLIQTSMGAVRQRIKAEKSEEPAIITLQDFLGMVLTSKNEKIKPFRDALLSISYLRVMNGKVLPSALDEFSEDLTLAYESGKLSPVIGRDAEAIKMLTALTKVKKRNPLLVGEAGTGKTAIVEKLAGWLVDKKVPAGLIREDGRGYFLKQLNWSKIEALGPGQAKAALEEIIQEVKDRNQETLIFMDETHRINPEYDTQGIANMWKEPLARGHIALIGATTQDEYRKRIKKDPALDRRFHEVPVQEPSLPETHTILRGLREYFELKHHVVLRDDALEAAAYKSKRYMPGKFMPDCGVDVIDTACAMVKNQVQGTAYPRLLKEGELYLESIKVRLGLQKRVSEFQADLVPLEAAVGKKKDALLTAIRTGLTASHPQLDETLLKSATEAVVEKRLNPLLTPQTAVPAERLALQEQIEQGFSEPVGDLVKTIRQTHLKRRTLGESEKELETVQAKIETLKAELVHAQLLPVVGVPEILAVISDQANVPIQKLSEDEEEKLLKMKDEVRKRVIGQGPAVEAMVAAIQKNKLGMTKGNRPIGSFLFVGPTGVGKTELAKTVAEFLFGDENSMIRVDMSELMEEHSVSKLIGSPPGYVGYDDGGQLTEKVRKRPYSVVLLDEVEKAHPRVFDLLLQILDDGRLTDSHGRTVDFKNAIVVMTSNKGTAELMKQFEQVGGDMDPDSPRFSHMYRNLRKFAKKVITSDQRTFRPEFLNRIDDIVVFHPLMQAHIKDIIPIQLKQLNKDLLNTEAKVQVKLEPSALEYLAEKGTDVINGARPLKRLMDNIKSVIAEGLLKKTIQPGDTLNLTADLLKAWEAEIEARRKQ